MVYLITNQRSAFTPVGYSITTVEESLKYLNKLDSIAFDTETRGFDPYTCGLISAQFGDADKQYVVDCETVDINLYKELLETKEIINDRMLSLTYAFCIIKELFLLKYLILC